jgi:hypothetical protein
MNGPAIDRTLLVLTFVTAGAWTAGAIMDYPTAARALLVATMTWIAVPLGSLAIVFTHNLTGGRWGDACRGFLQATIATLPLFIGLLVVLGASATHIFAWIAPPADIQALVSRKHFYLNLPFLEVRLAAYCVLWLGLAALAGAFGRRARASAGASGGGLLIWAVSVTYFSFDWLMSLEPAWYSDIFGMVMLSSQLVTAVAVMILGCADRLKRAQREGSTAMPDVGNLWLTVIVAWIMLTFSQYLIIWNADLPDEIGWYLHRGAGGWQWVQWLMYAFYFALPFAALLFAASKRNVRVLVTLAVVVLAGHVAETCWLILPAFSPGKLEPGWTVPVAITSVGAAAVLLCRIRLRGVGATVGDEAPGRAQEVSHA